MNQKNSHDISLTMLSESQKSGAPKFIRRKTDQNIPLEKKRKNQAQNKSYLCFITPTNLQQNLFKSQDLNAKQHQKSDNAFSKTFNFPSSASPQPLCKKFSRNASKYEDQKIYENSSILSKKYDRTSVTSFSQFEQKDYSGLIQQIKQQKASLILQNCKLQQQKNLLITQNSRLLVSIREKAIQIQQLKNVAAKAEAQLCKYLQQIAKKQENNRNLSKIVDQLSEKIETLNIQRMKMMNPQMRKEKSLNRLSAQLPAFEKFDELDFIQRSSNIVQDLSQRLKYKQIEAYALKKMQYDAQKSNQQVARLKRENRHLKDRIHFLIMRKSYYDQSSERSLTFSLEMDM